MKKLLFLCCTTLLTVQTFAKHKKDEPATPSTPPAKPADSAASKKGPKAFDKVITDKAVSRKGLFTVHKLDDKYYFEIPDSLLGREIEMTSRFSKTAGGGGVYAGEIENEQTLIWEKGPNKKHFPAGSHAHQSGRFFHRHL